MAHLRCDECKSSDTNAFGSWDTPIKILCKNCSDKKRDKIIKEPPKDNMNKKTLALAAMNLALAASSPSSIPYAPKPKALNPNPYRHKQCKSCKAFKYCYINKYNNPKQQACVNYIKRK